MIDKDDIVVIKRTAMGIQGEMRPTNNIQEIVAVYGAMENMKTDMETRLKATLDEINKNRGSTSVLEELKQEIDKLRSVKKGTELGTMCDACSVKDSCTKKGIVEQINNMVHQLSDEQLEQFVRDMQGLVKGK